MIPNHIDIVARLNNCFAHFDHVKEALQRLEDLMLQLPGGEARHLLLLGDSGLGKSRLLEHFVSKHPRVEHDEFTEIPVFYAPIPAKCSVKKMAGGMLKDLGSPFWNKGGEEDRTEQLKVLLKACKVRCVLLDEVNHLVDRGRATTHYFIGDWIKELVDAAGIPFVMAGTERSTRLLDVNEQLRSRFRERLTLKSFSMATPESAGTARVAVRTLQGLFKEIDAINLSEPGVCLQVMYSTHGRLREMKHLLSKAVELACKSKSGKLTLECLEEAFLASIFPSAPPTRNPFSPKFNHQPLTGANEPFAPGAR